MSVKAGTAADHGEAAQSPNGTADRGQAAESPNGAVDRGQVLEALNGIVDPCSVAADAPAGLVDMGLVRKCSVEQRGREGARIDVAISVTEPGCLMHAMFVNEARERLAALAGVAEVEVRFDYATDWHPGRMSAAYRAQLAGKRAGALRSLAERREAGDER